MARGSSDEMGPASTAVASVDDLRLLIRKKSRLKGRQADDRSLAEVRALLGEPRPSAGYGTGA